MTDQSTQGPRELRPFTVFSGTAVDRDFSAKPVVRRATDHRHPAQSDAQQVPQQAQTTPVGAPEAPQAAPVAAPAPDTGATPSVQQVPAQAPQQDAPVAEAPPRPAPDAEPVPTPLTPTPSPEGEPPAPDAVQADPTAQWTEEIPGLPADGI